MFPIIGGPADKPPEKLWADAVHRWLREIHPNHRAVIESLQVHKRPPGEKNPLLRLRDLDDADKHRLLNVVMVPGSGLVNPHPAALAIFVPYAFSLLAGAAHDPVRVHFGAEICRTKMPLPAGWRHIDTNMAGHIAPEMALADGLEAINALDWMGASVAKVIAKFLPLTHV
jgi:hypothetical protein